MLDNLSPDMYERITCSIAAARKYEIPANIILAVAEKENGRPDQWVRNTNGTHDVGRLQFNTSYLQTLARYGITAADVAAGGCYPFELAAWRLRQHIKNDRGDLWQRTANYHSRTPRLNEVYRVDLIKRAAKWADWLSAHYRIHEINHHSGTPLLSADMASRRSASPLTPSQTKLRSASAYVPRELLRSRQSQCASVLGSPRNDEPVNSADHGKEQDMQCKRNITEERWQK